MVAKCRSKNLADLDAPNSDSNFKDMLINGKYHLRTENWLKEGDKYKSIIVVSSVFIQSGEYCESKGKALSLLPKAMSNV
jgi:hypothetical protein